MEHTIPEWRRYILVQPPLMILIFAQAISSNILTDLIEYRTCSIILGINKTECSLLHENSSCAEALRIDGKVQPITSLILMSKSFIESIIPAFLSLFLGPWSDMCGRKPIMISGYIGVSLGYFILSFMTVLDISPWFLLLAFVPSICLGGFCVILLGTMCYITDISSEHDRAWHLAWMEAFISVGIIIGILTGPIIFQAYGYTTIFGCSTICCIVATFYIYLFVPETICNRNSVTLNNLFDIHLVKELFTACTKKRDGFNRYIVWCCITCIVILLVTSEGSITIGYLFASARLGWDVNKYSIYMASTIMLITSALVLGAKTWTKYLGFSEEIAAILSLFSSLSGCLVRSFTWKSWHMYLSAVIEMFGGISSPMLRSILSKSVPAKDTGKVFSLSVSIETLTPLVGASLYGLIYSHFMPPIYPSPVWLISVGLYIIVIFLIISIRIQNKKCNSMSYTSLSEDNNLSSQNDLSS